MPKIAVEAPNQAVLGVAFTVRARAERPAGESLALDVVRVSTSAFSILSVIEKPEGLFEITALPLDLGPQSLALVWTFGGGHEPQAMSTPVALTVTEPESLKEAPELRDIKPPRQARARWWPWLLAAALLAAAAAAWRRRAATAPLAGLLSPAPPLDARTPEQRALEELAALEASSLWSEGRHQDFYLALTDILRRYLEARGRAPATRLTTGELLRALRREGVGRSALTLVKDLFGRADLIKFARARAEESGAAADLRAARDLVAELAPKTAAAPGAP